MAAEPDTEASAAHHAHACVAAHVCTPGQVLRGSQAPSSKGISLGQRQVERGQRAPLPELPQEALGGDAEVQRLQACRCSECC